MEGGMPNTYATTTTTTTRTVFFDKSMFRSREVLLKIGEVLVCLIGLICVSCAPNPYISQAGFFYFLSSVGIVVALVMMVLYVVHLRDKMAGTLRLNFVEMVYAALWSFFFFAAAIACVVLGSKFSNGGAYIAAGFFGFVAMVLYGIDAFIMYNAWRHGTTRSATQTTQQASTPAY
ncbi:CKLF-like MARVEL transmembrane domain-containing protein 3 [Pollicipes pollicipes]|uniref:CKLF-like MARVEL transmembrane domain-containing protein 3 n=1 Tax=Pollicipes pollicipes TaxID=41117 RepID=UPI0018853A6D|nr:CKLF-like MARVEL transmembrane domain-containing protein 3 [Pollicipes pollicipes]XP_037077640.1 CKLF-like MARVEL transmembrane domain-containing protein 3 [Pollicipes pollicipes]